MVVDDDENILTLVGAILEKAGYEVILADSGEACLEILKDEKPDLILMDIMMPGMDGWEVVREIREDKSNSDIIISMLTVKNLDKDKEKSLSVADADYHISKPLGRKEDLLKTVETLLGQRD